MEQDTHAAKSLIICAFAIAADGYKDIAHALLEKAEELSPTMPYPLFDNDTPDSNHKYDEFHKRTDQAVSIDEKNKFGKSITLIRLQMAADQVFKVHHQDAHNFIVRKIVDVENDGVDTLDMP